MGGFSLPDIYWSTLSGSSEVFSQLYDLAFELNLSQIISQPTHSHGNTIDLIRDNLIISLSILSDSPLPISTGYQLLPNLTVVLHLQSYGTYCVQ